MLGILFDQDKARTTRERQSRRAKDQAENFKRLHSKKEAAAAPAGSSHSEDALGVALAFVAANAPWP